MKKEITVMQDFCDFCGSESNHWNTCMSCGKNICYDCRKVHAKEYPHGIYVSGSGDGLYCKACDKRLTNSDDKLHTAYRLLESLRDENRKWNENFSVRSYDAENALETLFKEVAA